MSLKEMLSLELLSRKLVVDENGYRTWKRAATQSQWPAKETALIICDVWDKHWSRGANERLAAMLPRMAATVDAARAAGLHIIHAPSDTVDYYAGTPARRRIQEAPPVEPPAIAIQERPPLPVQSVGECSDTGGEERKVWSRQHPQIAIDQERDAISDNGREVYRYFIAHGIRNVIFLGVHTNMCILNRSFAIKNMVGWGFNAALIRDLTDAMYDPADPPYVSHEEGTRLVIEYIEKFWCPTISSEMLAGGRMG
ncbi:MAG: isochorismatase hydrolase [Paenibacillaceae bacterium]|nr:isochorismatase hydrolase [Paenibacillaceae bacterium]